MSGVPQPLEILQPGKTAADLLDFDTRQQLLRLVNLLGLLSPGNPITGSPPTNTTMQLGGGIYPAFNGATTGFCLRGIAGSRAATATISSFGTVTGLWFTSKVTLQATARVVFADCRFDAGVVTANGARAEFIGGFFANNSFVDGALSAIGDVTIIGAMRGAAPHVNVTILSEIVV